MHRSLVTLFASFCVWAVGHAGQLDKEDVSRQLDGRYTIGEVQADMRAYPVFIPAEDTADNKPKLIGYAFETVDFTSIRGYSGKPINMFVLMDLEGKFLKVRLLEHNEPLFLSIHSHAKLVGFANQYVQLSLQHEIDIHVMTNQCLYKACIGEPFLPKRLTEAYSQQQPKLHWPN